MKKIVIKVDTAVQKHASQQNLMAQRMPARVYKDKKKEASRRSCREKIEF